MRSTDLVVRPAVEDDAGPVASVYLSARKAAPMPPPQHTDDAIRYWIDAKLQGEDETWVAECQGIVVGYARFTPTWLDDLYVAPPYARQGVGSALLDVVKAHRPGGFRLWVFESNRPARDFYAASGLVELERTDGRANEEQSPDILAAWPGEEPLAFLRSLVDEVDDELGALLQRRATLTAVIQRHKPVGGHEGRDLAREREIAARLAEAAPGLGADRLQRIVHAIVTESLDAALDRGL